MKEFLVGRKDICDYFRVSWDTMMRWAKFRNFPLLQEPGHQPIVNLEAVRSWERKRRQELKKRQKTMT